MQNKYTILIQSYQFHPTQVDYDPDGFQWDENVQGQILGSFFSLHFLLQLPGGKSSFTSTLLEIYLNRKNLTFFSRFSANF